MKVASDSMKKIVDGRDYHWRNLTLEGPSTVLLATKGSRLTNEVSFKPSPEKAKGYFNAIHGVEFSKYSSGGSIDEISAVELEDGRIIAFIMSSHFRGTFDEGSDVRSTFYELTPRT